MCLTVGIAKDHVLLGNTGIRRANVCIRVRSNRSPVPLLVDNDFVASAVPRTYMRRFPSTSDDVINGMNSIVG